MADIKLGISGSETTLPQINWIGRNAPRIPTHEPKNLKIARMSDGSRRFARLIGKKTFRLNWGNLIYTEVETLRTLKELNQVLRYQNNWESSDYFNVVVTSLRWSPIVTTYIQTNPRYVAELVLTEA